MDDLASPMAFAVSPQGDLLAARGASSWSVGRRLVAISRDGTIEPLLPMRRTFTGNVRPSPDGTRLLVTVGLEAEGRGGKPMGAHIVDLLSGTLRPLDGGMGNTVSVAEDFAPDGRIVTVVFWSLHHYELALLEQEGAEPEFVLPIEDKRGAQRGFTMTPDQRYLLFQYLPDGEAGGDGIYMVDLELPVEERSAVPVVVTDASEGGPDLSPDGKWLAYMSDINGLAQIFVRPFDAKNIDARVRSTSVTREGGRHPAWSLDGKRIYFMSNDNGLMSAEAVFTGDQVRFAEPREIFSGPQLRLHSNFGFHQISELPDGRFVYVREPELDEMSVRYDYVLNWTAGLKQGN